MTLVYGWSGHGASCTAMSPWMCLAAAQGLKYRLLAVQKYKKLTVLVHAWSSGLGHAVFIGILTEHVL